MATPKRQSSILNFFNSPKAQENKEPNCPTPKSISINEPKEVKPITPLVVDSPKKDEASDERYDWILNPRDFSGHCPGEDGYNPSQLYIPPQQWKKFTPFEKQFWEIKSKMYDSVVFFKKGKFYELYENDADIASSMFDLKVADRVNMKMAGVPESSFHIWASKFVSAGFKVVKVDQKDNSISKQIKKKQGDDDDSKIIQREVSGVLTIGTLVDPSMIQGAQYSFCLALYIQSGSDDSTFDVSACFADFTLREYVSENYSDNQDLTRLAYSLNKYNPKEIVIPRYQDVFINRLQGCCPNVRFSFLDGNIDTSDHSTPISNAVMNAYLKELLFTQEFSVFKPIPEITKTCAADVCSIDGRTLSSLEIVSSDNKVKTLWKVFDKTKTASGSRKLYRWLTNPLCSLSEIKERQEATLLLYQNATLRDKIRQTLSSTPDIERAVMSLRISKDLKQSIESLITSTLSLSSFTEYLAQYLPLKPFLKDPIQCWADLKCVLDITKVALDSNTDEELLNLEKSLKVLLNDLNDYKNELSRNLGTQAEYRDVGKEHFLLEVGADVIVPKEFFAMSRTKTSVRYWSQYLKNAAAKHDELVEMIRLRKESLHYNLADQMTNSAHLFKSFLSGISAIDCFQSMATFASSFGDSICMPDFIEGKLPQLRACEMRHPLLGMEPFFIANDIHIPSNECRVVLLTGPNMGGKSTLMKQVCVVAILAQIGSFVPAKNYTSTIFTSFHTRMGADDNILKGSSTFMCELEEAMSILRSIQSTDQANLVIMDEFGRGTSTHDGAALASTILNELKNSTNTLAIFSTHYRQLSDSVGDGIDKKFMGFTEAESGPIFTYKLKSGVSPSSFAFNVAKSVGIPKSIIDDAKNAANIFKAYKNDSFSKSYHIDEAMNMLCSTIDSLDTEPNK